MVKTRIYFDDKKGKWLDVPTKDWKQFESENFVKTINIHNRLREKLDNVKKIVKRKWDAVFLIDGMERIGKSTLGMTAAWYLSDAKLTIDNFAAGMQDAAEKIEKLPDKSILFVDEGSLVFNSKDSMTKESKRLQKVLDVVGQKNMIFIIVLPSFFDLNKNIATRRSKFLLHVYTASDMKRGRFTYFGPNKKRYLYALGKKNFGSYTKPKSDWLGDFDDFQLPFDEEYKELKKKSLAESLSLDGKGDGKIKLGEVRAMYVQKLMRNYEGISTTKLAQAINTSTKTIYADMEREIPEALTQIKMSHKRIKVDLMAGLEC